MRVERIKSPKRKPHDPRCARWNNPHLHPQRATACKTELGISNLPAATPQKKGSFPCPSGTSSLLPSRGNVPPYQATALAVGQQHPPTICAHSPHFSASLRVPVDPSNLDSVWPLPPGGWSCALLRMKGQCSGQVLITPSPDHSHQCPPSQTASSLLNPTGAFQS